MSIASMAGLAALQQDIATGESTSSACHVTMWRKYTTVLVCMGSPCQAKDHEEEGCAEAGSQSLGQGVLAP